MLSDVTISNIKRNIVVDIEIRKLLDKIQEIENKNTVTYVKGLITADTTLLKRLYNNLHVLVEDRNMLQLFFETLDLDFLNEVYMEIYNTEDENKFNYLEYINELIKNRKEKEMVR